MTRCIRFGAVALAVFLLHCSGDDAAATDTVAGEIAFHADDDALPGFSKQIGPLPSASDPAQLSFALSSGGKIVVDAKVTKSASGMTGTSGMLSLDLHFKATGNLKVDSPLKKYDGPIPSLDNLDIAITGSIPFTPFVLDGHSADLTVNVPETKLPDIPLGSVPGTLQLTVVAGSTVSTSLAGRCLRTEGGKAFYSAATTIGGRLVLKGALKLDLPKPLDKVIDLGEIPIPIPELVRPLDFAAVEAAGVADGKAGACDGTLPTPPTAPSNSEDAGGAGTTPVAGGMADGGMTDGGNGDGGGSVPVSLSINGGPATVTKVTYSKQLFQHVLTIESTVGTVHVAANRTGANCDMNNGVNYVAGAPPAFISPFGACGMTVTSLPDGNGAAMAGTFDGVVFRSDNASLSNSIKVTFAVRP